MRGEQRDGAPTDGPDRETTDCCSAGHPLPEDAVAADVETLGALANDTRYEALRLIAGADDDVCVCELEPSLGVSQGAVSQALSRLFAAGLVDRRKDGRWRYYSATPRAERILRVLDDTRLLDETRTHDETRTDEDTTTRDETRAGEHDADELPN